MSDDNQTTALSTTRYGDDATLQAVFERVRKMLPGAENMAEGDILALVQAALLADLNPVMGEIWLLLTKDGKSLGIMPGIKGARRQAQEWLDEHMPGQHYVVDQERIRPEDYATWSINPPPKGQSVVAYLTTLRIPQLTWEYFDRVDRIVKAGGTLADARGMLGPSPVWQGIGIWRTGEQVAKTKTPDWMARKRSEADALRHFQNAPFVKAGTGHALGQLGAGEPPAAVPVSATLQLPDGDEQDGEIVEAEGYSQDRPKRQQRGVWEILESAWPKKLAGFAGNWADTVRANQIKTLCILTDDAIGEEVWPLSADNAIYERLETARTTLVKKTRLAFGSRLVGRDLASFNELENAEVFAMIAAVTWLTESGRFGEAMWEWREGYLGSHDVHEDELPG